MKEMPLVSIIMNCHNGEQFLKDAINSIIGQTYSNWELIFWDNKSTDDSANIAKSYNDARIKYYLSKKKTVLYEARNFAIKKAKGKFIAFLDVDDMWSKNKLSLQMPKFKSNSTGLVYSNFFKIYKNKKKKIAYKNKLPKGNVTSLIIKNYQIGILTVIIRKKLMKNKLFDFKYDLLSDYDYVLSFSLKHNFESINQPLAFYRIHENQLQKKKIITQAKQYCEWFKKKKIEKKFKKFDLSSIYKKYEYYNLIKELDKSKIKLFLKLFKNFNLINFIKIIFFIFLPKKIVFKFIDNV